MTNYKRRANKKKGCVRASLSDLKGHSLTSSTSLMTTAACSLVARF